MVAIRPPQTSKYALRQAIDAGLMDEISAATGKKPKQLYKYSNPADPAELTVRAALLVEAICFEKKSIHPFADLFDTLRKAPSMRIASVRETVMKSQAGLGRVADTVIHALSAESEAGEKMSPNEIQMVLCELEKYQQIIDRLRHAVTSHAQGDRSEPA